MTSVKSITLWGMGLNGLLTGLKLTIGLLAHSQSCVADAVHSLSDFLTDIAVLIGVRFWSAPADSDHPHGHRRIESLITVFIGMVLGICAFNMAVDAIHSIAENTTKTVPGKWVLVIAVISIVTKEILYQWTAAAGRRLHSSAVIANAWHHRSDAISSVPVALVAIAGHFWPSITILDSIAAILVSCMLFRTAFVIAWPCLKELSDQGVSQTELESMRRIAESIPGIKEVHEMRTRRIGDGVFLDMHVLVERNMTVEDGHRLCEEAAASIQRKMPIVLDVLTHLEPADVIDIEAEIHRIAGGVPGVKAIHGIRVRNTVKGYDADLHVLVKPDLSVAEGHKICSQVRDALLASDLKIVGALTHLEPFYEE